MSQVTVGLNVVHALLSRVTPLIEVAVAAPRFGVVSDGDVDNTVEPEPVLVVTPVPPFATDKGRDGAGLGAICAHDDALHQIANNKARI